MAASCSARTLDRRPGFPGGVSPGVRASGPLDMVPTILPTAGHAAGSLFFLPLGRSGADKWKNRIILVEKSSFLQDKWKNLIISGSCAENGRVKAELVRFFALLFAAQPNVPPIMGFFSLTQLSHLEN